MTISEAESRLFDEWSKVRKPFVSDGVVSEKDYQASSQKIAFILKEVNDEGGGGWDLREFLRNDGGRSQTWDNVTRWVHGMRQLLSRSKWFFYEEISGNLRKETLKSIVAMNLKKSPGGPRTDLQVLKDVATKDAPYIQKQYAIYDPDITICGGDDTADLFQKAVDHQREWRKTGPIGAGKDEISWYRRNADPEKPKYVVAYWHPAAHMNSRDLLSNLLDVVAEINRSLDR